MEEKEILLEEMEVEARVSYTRPIQLKSPQMYGEDVKAVQRKLNELNYDAGTVDGYYGPTGVSAVKDFQGKNGLSVDGSVGPATWNKLFASLQMPKYKRAIQLKSPQMNGTDVRLVQKRLNALKYNAGTVDGYYGPTGVAAVKDFQKVNGLSVDGSVGPATWNKLFSSSAKPKGTIGKQEVYVTTNSPIDDLSLRVNKGGTLYVSDYVMNATGYYGQKKRWYKNNEWKSGSTEGIYNGINGANKAYDEFLKGLKDAWINLVIKPFPTFDKLKDEAWDTMKKILNHYIEQGSRSVDIINLENLTEEEISNHVNLYMKEILKEEISILTETELEETMNMYLNSLSDQERENLTDEDLKNIRLGVVPVLSAIVNLMKAYEIFKMLKDGFNAVQPAARLMLNTLQTIYHFNQIKPK